jgi:hypothetical protein
LKTQKLIQNGSQGPFGSVKSLKDGFIASSVSTNVPSQNGSLNYNQTASINYDFMDSQNSRLKQPSTTNSKNIYF